MALASIAAGIAAAQQYTAITYAGISNVRGFFGDSGPATSAQLNNPTRLAFDAKGNMYFVDYSTYLIRKVDTAGIITTLAGIGRPGYSGDAAIGTSAAISQVHGIAANAAGDVYFADTSSNVIRKINASDGFINTIAGTGAGGYSGDSAAALKAQLYFPISLVIDGSGVLYVTDYYNNAIRKIDSSGKITTLVGGPTTRGYSGDGGAASKAAIADPYALALDSAGNLYFSEIGNQVIRKIDKSGNISTVATGIATEAIAVDATGTIFYTDYPNSSIRKILPNGGPNLRVAGTGQAGYNFNGAPADITQLNQPNGLAFDSKANLYVADSSNQIIRQLTPNYFSVSASTNAASNLQTPVAPGEIVTLYGVGVGPAKLAGYEVSNNFFSTNVAGTQVLIGGILAPIVYTSASQLAVIVPYGISGPTTNITIAYNGNTSGTLQVNVASAAPGIFTADSTGVGQAAAVNPDGSLNSAAKPAKIGGFVSLYITGDGLESPANVDGKILLGDPWFETTLPRTVLPVTATIGGQNATVLYSGGAPNSVAGLTQMNLSIPAGITPGSAVPVVVTVGGVSSQTVTLAISN